MAVSRHTTSVLQAAAVATGNGTAMTGLEEFSSVIIRISGITTATITFEVSEDGTTWQGINCTSLVSGAKAATATADGIWIIPTLGCKQFRARISAWTSGTINVTGRPNNDITVFP